MTVYKNNNDAVEGERVICQYTKMTGHKLLHTSESHRGVQDTLHDALCVVTKPLRATQYKK